MTGFWIYMKNLVSISIYTNQSALLLAACFLVHAPLQLPGQRSSRRGRDDIKSSLQVGFCPYCRVYLLNGRPQKNGSWWEAVAGYSRASQREVDLLPVK